MKRQLIRFACHNCGARLAVPVSMGGRSDRCPKCQEVITAPLESEESSLPPAPAEKIPAPKKKTAPPAAAETAPPPEAQPDLFHGLRPSLLDDFLGGPLKQEPSLPESPPPAPPAPPGPTKEAPKLKKMVAQVPEAPAPFGPPPISLPEPQSIAPPAAPPSPPPAVEAKAEEEAPSPEEVLSAPKWTLPSLDPEPEHEKAEDALQLVGMGHVLERQSTSQALHTTRQGGAPIGVGLMHLGDLPGRQRRRRWRLIGAVGISLIVIVDFTLWVFWSEIKEWWYTPAQVETEAHPLPKPKPASDAPAKTEAQQNKGETSQHLPTPPPVIAKKEEPPTPPKKEEPPVIAKKEEPKPEPPPEKTLAPAPSISAANKPEDKKTLEEKPTSANPQSPATAPPAPIPSVPPGTLAGLTDLPTSPAPSTISINKPGEPGTKPSPAPSPTPKKEAAVAASTVPAPPSPAPIPTPEPKSTAPAPLTAVETEKPKPAPDKKEAMAVADVSKPAPSPVPPTPLKEENRASAPLVPATPLPVLMPSTAGSAPAPIPLPGVDGNPGTLFIPPVPPPAPTSPAPVAAVKPEPESEAPIVVATAPVMTKTEAFVPPIPPPVPGDPSASSPTVSPSPEKPSDDKTLPPPADANADATPQPKVSESRITAAARPATEALKKFLFASNWQERLKYCQKPGNTGPLMEKYYKSRPDGPVRVGQIELKERYAKTNGRTPYCMFELSGGVLKQPVLALVEEPARDTPRVDWEAFVEFKDRLLWEFLERPGAAPQKFRVMVRRKHYFDKDVPHMDSKEAFMIVQPGIDAEGHVFAPMGSKPARQLAQHLGWNATISAVLELAWRKEDSHRWVEIAAISGYSWKTSTSEE